MLAAQQLLNKVRTEKPTLVESMRLLSEAYIELAYCSVSHLRKQQHGMTFMFRQTQYFTIMLQFLFNCHHLVSW